MALAPGTRLGPYDILAPIGAGGMGEVYRAKDTKLKRDVALKVLPAAFARDPDRMARFQREAEVLASLNHPNIAAIYGVEHADGMQALAMEMVEGESPKGPLGFDEAWHIASQIAGALEYAHDKGVIHRDLKPANVKVTPDGVVKLLDFGLAKAFSLHPETRASGSGENSPTLTMGATEVGMILGTAAYMSSEQARGRAVDKRADIWSFGVVLYELLTGERLFQGEDAAETLAAVIQKQPDLSRVPAKARRLLERCLEKDPKKRLRDIGDARALLVETPAVDVPAPSRSRLEVVWMIAAGVLLFALAATSWALFRATRPADLKPLVRLDVDLGPNVSLGSQAGADAILSPDGTRLVYVSQGKLFTRKLDQPEGVELAGTEGAFSPFFSPDGKWVAFFAVGKLKKLSVEGGAPVVLVDAPNASSGTWGEDGNIIASFSNSSLSRIPSAGGTPTPVTELAPGEFRHNWPQVLPGGKALLFSSATSNGNNIDIVSLKDGRRKILQKGGLFGRYVPTSNGAGHLMYVNNGTLFAVAFDLDALEVRGTPVPVLDQVAYNPQYGSAQLDFSGVASGPGTLLYRRGGATASKLVTVQWLDSEGKMQPLLAKPGAYTRLRLSPDGQRLALEILGGSSRDIWIYEGQRDTMTLYGVPTAATSFSQGKEASSGPAPMGRVRPSH
ncbi:MAG: protein kinase [Acidobacteriota bacterium]